MTRILILLLALIAGAMSLESWPTSQAQRPQESHPTKFRRAKRPIANEYIVVLKRDTPSSQVDELANALAHAHGGRVLGVLRDAVKAFLIRLPEQAAIALAKNHQVLLVEQNAQSEPVEEPESVVYGYEPYGGSEELLPEAAQSGAPWSLDRIDQRSNPFLDGVYRYNRTGQGVDAYVIDTGILLTHNEFGGRAIFGYDWDPNSQTGVDCHGHGTHVAGLVGGRNYGSAKNVRLYAVRIADCAGNSNAFVAMSGVNWAINRHDTQVPHRPAVMNISYAFSYYDYNAGALDDAVNTAIAHGITVVIAAGNFNGFSGGTSPQGSGTAVINVAATDIDDVRAQFSVGGSNFGGLVDLFAPGKTIPSAGISSNTAVINMSGTSMASPLTAGVAAMYLEAFPTASPATVSNALVTNATVGEVQDADPYGGAYTPNRLLYSFFIPPPPHIIFFNSSSYSANESNGFATITVNRSGNDLPPVTVDYASSDGSAQQKGDYTIGFGKLSFGAGETSKTFQVLITNDGYVENNETVNLTLSNPTGGASLGVPNTAVLTISSNDSSASQPIDGVEFFVEQQYRDILNRLPDSVGFQNWVNTLANCPNGGFGEPPTSDCDRLHVAAGFFQSDEYLNRGYFAFRFYMVAFGQRPTYAQFIPDMSLVGGPKSTAEVEAAKVALADAFVQRQAFIMRYGSQSGQTLANSLLQTAGLPPGSYSAGSQTNGQILRGIAETSAAFNKFLTEGTVSILYFGFQRRDPDPVGYQNNVDTLNADPNNLRHMIFIFIYSTEYRERFGPS